MQPDSGQHNALLNLTQKELSLFFKAPTAWLFLVAFLLVSLYIFFWVESFFARNIADVRPLFEWMPLLLIFLSAALTMKMWSEERRSGTLEHVLTQPVPLWQFVIAKFFACVILLAIALLLTLPLVITVSLLGDLDWGPVWSGYVAALLLGAAYLSMGLFVSSRCDNQIVSLILTVLLAGGIYLLGSDMITSLFSHHSAEILRNLGTGARFESITRGMLDFRDLYYYVSLIVAFIALNIFALERGRWAADGDSRYHRTWRLGIGLVLANVLLANVWLSGITTLRWDTTRGNIYSISPATEDYLRQLQEPLLIRGYFSQKTHPLLAPLVPQLQDLLYEYEVVGDGRVKVEIIDPMTDPVMEDEANKRFNIQPTPFRVNDRHQSAVVNSYFDLLIQYGDEHQVLHFSDLIEVKTESEGDIEVRLRNPEYDITRALKQALYTYQAGGDVFSAITKPLHLTAYISPDDKLPQELQDLRRSIEQKIESLKIQAGDKLTVEFVDPDHGSGDVARKITEEYGFVPMAADLLGINRFYFYITLGQGEQLLQIPLGDYSESTFAQGLDASIKRFAQGFTRTVAFVAPQQMDPHVAMQLGQAPESKPRFNTLKQLLNESMNVVDEDLSDGRVDPIADIVFLAAPQLKGNKERFAVDQFLMRGGTVIVATSPYSANMTRTDLTLQKYDSGIQDWLNSMGIELSEKLVLDQQNNAFPVPTVREVSGLRFQEIRMVDYPYFINVRGAGLNADVQVTAGLPQVTVPWASAITLRDDTLIDTKVTELLHSSDHSWLGDAQSVTPTAVQVQHGYTPSGETQRRLLAVAVQGRFNSSFAGQDSPLLEDKGDKAPIAESDEGIDATDGEQSLELQSVLNRSVESARIVVFASNDMFRDQIVNMLSSISGGTYLNSLQLALNTVDWSLADEGLLSIRSRGHFNRTLKPMAASTQQFWEYVNYVLAIVGLAVVGLIVYLRSRARTARYQRWLSA